MATTIEKQTTTEAITITRPPILERVERIRAVRQSSRMGVGIFVDEETRGVTTKSMAIVLNIPSARAFARAILEMVGEEPGDE
jgi:putative intracellular protease/amidase